MIAADAVHFATRALTRHRLRSGLSLLGMTVGVTAVVLLTSLGEGARIYVTGEFAAMGSNVLVLSPGKTETTGLAPPIVTGAPHDLTLEDVAAIDRLPDVRRTAPMTMGSATVRVGDLTRDVFVIGATAEWKDVRSVPIATGRFIAGGESGRRESVCVIGATVQRELFPGRSALGEMLRVGEQRCRVVGVTASRGTSLGMNLDDIVLMPIERHMKMFDLTTLFHVLIEVRTHDAIAPVKTAAVAAVARRHGEEDITIVSQESMLATFSGLLSILSLTLAGIAAISLSVAGIGIMNVMLVSVSERAREIGLLKAIGATPAQILGLFVTEAALLSAVGGALGVGTAAGLIAVAREVYPLFPMQPPAWAVPAALGVSTVIGIAFGAIPARRAARLEPIGALARARA